MRFTIVVLLVLCGTVASAMHETIDCEMHGLYENVATAAGVMYAHMMTSELPKCHNLAVGYSCMYYGVMFRGGNITEFKCAFNQVHAYDVLCADISILPDIVCPQVSDAQQLEMFIAVTKAAYA